MLKEFREWPGEYCPTEEVLMVVEPELADVVVGLADHLGKDKEELWKAVLAASGFFMTVFCHKIPTYIVYGEDEKRYRMDFLDYKSEVDYYLQRGRNEEDDGDGDEDDYYEEYGYYDNGFGGDFEYYGSYDDFGIGKGNEKGNDYRYKGMADGQLETDSGYIGVVAFNFEEIRELECLAGRHGLEVVEVMAGCMWWALAVVEGEVAHESWCETKANGVRVRRSFWASWE